PLRLLIVGCGGIATAWLEPLSLRTDVVIVGLADLDQQRARERRDAFAAQAEIGSDPAMMIDTLKPDVVIDLTIPEAHAEIACMALGRGCHVLAEKPMAASMAEARRIREASQASGRIHAVMQNRRYLPGIRRVRQMLDAQAIGPLAEIHADFFLGAHFGGFRDAMPHVLLLDMAIHTVDQARFLGDLVPVAVNAVEWNPPGSWYERDASAMLVVECAGGIRFTYRGSWCAEGRGTSWQADWRLIGRSGQLRWDGDNEISATIIDPNEQGLSRQPRSIEPAPELNLALTSHAGCIDDMLSAIRAGRQPPTHGGDNIHSLAIIHAAIASANAGGARVAIADM
ncbi:MAG: gfo/Idh/MocA family oxidoreductase, partial [Planctomycetota bacterium]